MRIGDLKILILTYAHRKKVPWGMYSPGAIPSDPPITKDFVEMLTNISTKMSWCSILLKNCRTCFGQSFQFWNKKILQLNDHLRYHRQRNKEQQSCDILTLNSKRAHFQFASLFQLLPVDFFHFSI